ncbi:MULTISPECIES: glycerophosphodiester phosphodiesterase family protein [Lactobacillus]|uniref:Glycerophosphodiester phosphodiesterase n=1 Tax=Lactobacillus xujianguonis TaxID=2495899 RepID=A0A437SV37_9LACO|nr:MULTISPECIES: glycerophosphodiester phosphodiesterase family protein [Lactobacillus]RVU70796.1 glycerophosphodiester phosphodiesterase [Lactobacillus xujianguonis]RVU77012.1 glycerophosphodiester phosphodiesterase [Lactobacillus xujianguonis]
MKTVIFGHRGYPAKFTENSLEGFRYALEHGAEGVEFDVQLTKDSVPIVMHDEKVDRTTDGQGWVKDFTLAEIRQLHLANGEPVPELKELFGVLENHDLLINLEFKTSIVHYPGIEKTVFDLAKQYQFVHPIIFSSFDYVTLKNCQELDPTGTYCYLVDQKVMNPRKLIEENHFAGIHPGEYFDDDAIVQRIWTVDDPELAKKYFAHHIAGMFTNNYPAMIKLRDEIQK